MLKDTCIALGDVLARGQHPARRGVIGLGDVCASYIGKDAIRRWHIPWAYTNKGGSGWEYELEPMDVRRLHPAGRGVTDLGDVCIIGKDAIWKYKVELIDAWLERGSHSAQRDVEVVRLERSEGGDSMMICRRRGTRKLGAWG